MRLTLQRKSKLKESQFKSFDVGSPQKPGSHDTSSNEKAELSQQKTKITIMQFPLKRKDAIIDPEFSLSSSRSGKKLESDSLLDVSITDPEGAISSKQITNS